jgi:hypothetical protein
MFSVRLPLIALGVSLAFGVPAQTSRGNVEFVTLAKEKTESREITVSVPRFRITGPLKSRAENAARAFANEQLAEFREIFKDGDVGPGPKFLEATPVVATAHAQLVSFRYDVSTYTGGAHPNSFTKVFNYGVVNRRVKSLTLSDLLLRGKRATDLTQKVLIPAINRAQKERGGDPASALSVEQVNAFVIHSQGLTWHFSPYELGPYAEGGYEIKLTWEQMKGYIDPAGLVRFARGNAR